MWYAEVEVQLETCLLHMRGEEDAIVPRVCDELGASNNLEVSTSLHPATPGYLFSHRNVPQGSLVISQCLDRRLHQVPLMSPLTGFLWDYELRDCHYKLYKNVFQSHSLPK